MASINIFARGREQGFEQYLYIHPQRPVLDIEQIEFNALLHELEALGLTTKTTDLSQPGYSRFDLVPEHVPMNALAQLLVHDIWMGPGSDNGHFTAQDVDELGQFIQ